MNADLYKHTIIIMDAAQALLNETEGPLNDKQRDITKTIIANAEKFLHICIDFQEIQLVDFSPEMRHELGNPLTPIRGYSDLLSMGVLGSLNLIQQARVQAICDSTEAVREMIEQMVEEARLLAAARLEKLRAERAARDT